MNEHRIKDIIHEVFAELAEEFELAAPIDEIDAYGVYVTYVGKEAGMRISYEPDDGGIFLMVFPLNDGTIPPYSRWYDIVDLLRAKGTQFEEPLVEYSHEPATDQLRRALEHFRDSVRSHAADFLKGDFRLCSRMDDLIAERKKRLRG